MGNFRKSGWSELEAGAAERNTTLRHFYEVFFLFSSCWCWSSCEFFKSCSIFLRKVLWKCETRHIYHQPPLCVMSKNSFLASKCTHFSTGVRGLLLSILSSDLICRPVQHVKDSSQVQAVESKQVWNRCDGPEVTARQQIKILKCHTIRTSVMITKLLLSLIVKSWTYVCACSGNRKTPWRVWRSSRRSLRPCGYVT